uniref:Uncharacterized protein n=1 Tax=Lepeophtheirus salmonis TaxID=72036 RepID=A0A0K2TXV0_LEPSM
MRVTALSGHMYFSSLELLKNGNLVYEVT